MSQFKDLEGALDRVLRAEYRTIDGQSPFHNLAGHLAEMVSGHQAGQLAVLINRVVDAVEGDPEALPGGDST
jgi:hypothetical protein